MNILLLNRNPIVSRLTKLSAQKLNFQVDEFSSIDEISGGNYTFIFVDNEVYSSELLDKLKGIEYSKVGFILPRGKDKPDGFDFYVEKPFLPTELVDILKNSDLSVSKNTIIEDEMKLDDNDGISELDDTLDDFDNNELQENVALDDDLSLEDSANELPSLDDSDDLNVLDSNDFGDLDSDFGEPNELKDVDLGEDLNMSELDDDLSLDGTELSDDLTLEEHKDEEDLSLDSLEEDSLESDDLGDLEGLDDLEEHKDEEDLSLDSLEEDSLGNDDLSLEEPSDLGDLEEDSIEDNSSLNDLEDLKTEDLELESSEELIEDEEIEDVDLEAKGVPELGEDLNLEEDISLDEHLEDLSEIEDDVIESKSDGSENGNIAAAIMGDIHEELTDIEDTNIEDIDLDNFGSDILEDDKVDEKVEIKEEEMQEDELSELNERGIKEALGEEVPEEEELVAPSKDDNNLEDVAAITAGAMAVGGVAMASQSFKEDEIKPIQTTQNENMQTPVETIANTNAMASVMKSLNIEALRELLAGAEVNIKINFPKKDS